MKFIIFSKFFLIYSLLFTNSSSCEKNLPESVKKNLNQNMLSLKHYFSYIKGIYSEIKVLEADVEKWRKHYEDKLYPKPMSRFSDSYGSPKLAYAPPMFMSIRKFESFAHQLHLCKVDINGIHSQVREGENRIISIKEKTQASEAMYKVSELKDMAAEKGENQIFDLILKYYKKRNELYGKILDSYEKMNMNFYFAIIPLTMITEDVKKYDKVGEQMESCKSESCKDWVKNWEFVRDTVAGFAEKDFSYDLYRNATKTENLLSLPIKNKSFR